MSSFVGINNRITKDVDLTIKNFFFNEENIRLAFDEIIHLNINDNTYFKIIDIVPIREEFEYPGFRARIHAKFDKSQNVIRIDITTGDVITPSVVLTPYKLLIEDRKINLSSYPIETVLAEKLESILSKNILSTRMKDYYDCYILSKTQINKIDKENFIKAINNTFSRRKTNYTLNNISNIMNLIKKDNYLRTLWNNYSTQFNYANNINFSDTIEQIERLLKIANII